MTTLKWYTSQNGWMIESAPGCLALDSFQPCEKHAPAGNRACERCDDGPMIEDGYQLGESDGAGYPILNEENHVVAYAHYQTPDGSLHVTREE